MAGLGVESEDFQEMSNKESNGALRVRKRQRSKGTGLRLRGGLG